jgi:hypothetical protein
MFNLSGLGEIMLSPEIEAFVQPPQARQEPGALVLKRGVVREVGDGEARVYVHDGALRLDEAGEIALYYEVEHRLHRHAARVVGTVGQGAGLLVELKMVGEAALAERRAAPRKCMKGSRLTADIGNECMCPVLDISACGFAVLGRARRTLGEVRRATMWVGDSDAEGQVRLTSFKRMDRAMMRYGFECANGEGESLGDALEKLMSDPDASTRRAAA